MNAVLSCAGLTVTYGQARALSDVTLDFGVGVTALVGPNGAGKSSLLRCLASVQEPASGRVFYAGDSVTSASVRERYRRDLGYLPQTPQWHEWMTVGECLRLFSWLRRVPRSARSRAVSTAMERVSLQDRESATVGSLSGGQRQRLMIATSLVSEPKVLLLDEPTVGLDPEQRIEIRTLIRQLSQDRAVCLSTHLMDDVALTADSLAILQQGRVIFSGSQTELLGRFDASASSGTTALEASYLALLRERG